MIIRPPSFPTAFVLIWALILSFQMTFGQGTPIKEYNDIVTSKNGSMMVGKITSMVPDSVLTMETSGGGIIILKWDEIDQIKVNGAENGAIPSKSTISLPSSSSKNQHQKQDGRPSTLDYVDKRPVLYRNKGYANATQFGIGFSQNNVSTSSFFLDHSEGYRFLHWLYIGAGAGLHRYRFQATFVPVFGEIRGDLLKENKITPFYFGKAGYSFTWSGNSSFPGETQLVAGGPFMHLGFGGKINTRSKIKFTFSSGFMFQRSEREFFSCQDWQCTNIQLNRVRVDYFKITFNTGFEF